MQQQLPANIQKYGLVYLGLVFFLFVFFKNAWIADDAYISFRSVEQIFAGNGPRWNMDERVQIYTSPLWFALLLLTRCVTNNLFLSTMVLSALCCLLALLMTRRIINDDKRWLLFVMLITGVWGIMDFTSSGLENPLLYFLLSIFFYYYYAFFRARELADKKHQLTALLLTLGIIAITRHDISTLVLMPTLYLVYVFFRHAGLQPALLFLLQKSYLVLAPLLLWTVFSVVYYGLPFPNTAYAKILHGIPRAELMDFGWLYLNVSLKFDLFAKIILLALFIRILWKRETVTVFVFAGIVLNFFYVVYVGGDFMLGRFTSEAMFVAAIGLLAPGTKPILSKNSFLQYGNAAAALVLLLLALSIQSPLKLDPASGFNSDEGRRHFSWRGILNERNFYFKTNSLWAYWHRDREQRFPNHKWCRMGESAAAQNKQASDFGGIGMYGYCAGLQLIIIDNLALAEPFLARLPKPTDRPWRAGHYHRDYPEGYYQSRLSGENRLQNPQLAALWNDMSLLTRAPLFTVARWQAIWRINSGYYQNVGEHYFADISAKGG